MNKQLYGTTHSGVPITCYTLNGKQISVQIINYGGIITSVNVPDRAGSQANVVLGYNNFPDYELRNPFFGCVVGRYANRIGKAQFTLDGKTYQLAANNGVNHLHGGPNGFDKKVWEVVREFNANGEEGIELHYLSPDGEENYPGNLDVHMTYAVTQADELRIEYHAVTDAPTIVNLTNHTLWNLAGEGNGAVYDHVLQINADEFTPVDAGAIPLGGLAPVAGTPFDFRQPTPIAKGIRSNHQQVVYGLGFDHNWAIRRPSPQDNSLIKAAEVSDPASGRLMEVWTTEPGIQIYTGNFFNAMIYGASQRAYRQGDGLAMETQHYPDSPNQPDYPSTVLRPGQTYRSATIYKFLSSR